MLEQEDAPMQMVMKFNIFLKEDASMLLGMMLEQEVARMLLVLKDQRQSMNVKSIVLRIYFS